MPSSNKNLGNNSTKLNKAWRRLDKTKMNHVKLLDNNSLDLEKSLTIAKPVQSNSDKISVYTYSVSKNLVKNCSKSLNLDINLTENIDEAQIILGLKSHLKDNLGLVLKAKRLGLPIYSIQKNTLPQIIQILSDIAS